MRSNETRNRALIEAIPDAIVCLSRDGTQLDVLLPPDFVGADAEAYGVGKKVSQVFPPETAEQVLKQIRQICSSTEVIVLSTHATTEHISRALQAGARGYLLRAVQFCGYMSLRGAFCRSNPRIAGRRLLRPLRFLAMTPEKSLELNSPGYLLKESAGLEIKPVVNSPGVFPSDYPCRYCPS